MLNMPEHTSSPRTKTLASRSPTASRSTNWFTKSGISKIRAPRVASLGHLLVGVWALLAATATATQSPLAQLLESQGETLLFELRGPVAPPQNIVILAMDDASMNQGTQFYTTDPVKYAYLEPLARWPWQRTAYAEVIDRLMQAGARAVALDILFDASSSYGSEDDLRFRRVLEKYPGKVVLAARYEEDTTAREGLQIKLTLPNSDFRAATPEIGFINFPLNANGRIHALGSEYPQLVAQSYPDTLAQAFRELGAATPSFAEAALKASKLAFPQPQGSNIFFYGPQGTFKQVPFWHVLDPVNWKELHLKHGTFKDKIVVIGATAGGGSLQDFQNAPFSGTSLYPNKMAGVEVQTSAIATLLENKSIRKAIPRPFFQGWFVLTVVVVAGYFQNLPKRLLRRFALAIGIIFLWGGISYFMFVQGHLILPSAVPIVAIGLSGMSYLLIGVTSEKLNLRRTMKQYASSPLVQEILSNIEQEDLRDLLVRREQELFGKRLAGRYVIQRVLGSGGFGETYVAQDSLRPGNPFCVVKQLRPVSNNPRILELARRLFKREAETLEKLGKHEQIPQLLAYFEEDEEFYLVQEFIEGHSLHNEIPLGKLLPEVKVIAMVQELLQILEFVHSQGVIHRDIKPSNIIRRHADKKLVLIDFGAVKEVHQLSDEDGQSSATIGIGTQGYMPNEQSGGKPRLNSDIYAVGIMGIQALTGVPPSRLKEDPYTSEIVWRDYRPQVSDVLAKILDKMVQRDFRKRYETAADVLHDLGELTGGYSLPDSDDKSPDDPLPLDSEVVDSDTAIAKPTQLWPATLEANAQDLPSTELPPTES
jgi:serine/threonine protein kinase/CHASE2 domain-containing sensor protein